VRVIEYASLAKVFGRSDLVMNSAFICAITIAVAIFPLAWLLGSVGIALAYLLSNVTTGAYLLFVYKKILKARLNDFYPWLRLLALAGLAFAGAAASSLVLAPWLHLDANTRILDLLWKLVVLFAFSGSLYGILVFLFARFQKKTVKAGQGV
jgi:hypothetical protein